MCVDSKSSARDHTRERVAFPVVLPCLLQNDPTVRDFDCQDALIAFNFIETSDFGMYIFQHVRYLDDFSAGRVSSRDLRSSRPRRVLSCLSDGGDDIADIYPKRLGKDPLVKTLAIVRKLMHVLGRDTMIDSFLTAMHAFLI